ncbi:MAG: NADH-quinone oxidoreductase subunit H, partial [bacterium]|nr:NADH-quinone oxidoreductase subunit H [bacterium]
VFALSLLIAPLLLGVINRTKAIWAGRTGQPILQVCFDLIKLLQKDSVYSRTTSWIFRAAPMISLAGLVTALLMIPWGGIAAPLSFSGDFLIVLCLLGLGRFFIVLAALDTGSSFEGMGASREVLFSAFTEPILFAVLITLVRLTDEVSLTNVYHAITPLLWGNAGAALILVAVILFVLLLTENSRIPVDDPNTHLELTMIHEVMVLDHSGPDFAFILYGSALKLWVFAALLAGVFSPTRTDSILIDSSIFLFGVFFVAVFVGIVESLMARLRLLLVPRMLVGACAVAAVSIYLTLK